MTSLQPLPEEMRQFLASLSDADLQKLAAWFAIGQGDMQQWNTGNAKGFQVRVEGGTAYIGDHYSIEAGALEQVLEKLLRDRQLPIVGTPQNLPYSGVTKFVGRDDELNRLHEQLQPGSPVAISAVSGMGGIGKTELALQYAREHCNEGSYLGGLCWLRARENVGTQIISFVRSCLELTPPEDLELVEKVRWCWGRWREGAVLLIFDDVQQYEDIEPFLPPQDSRFKVLLTTRSWLGKPVENFEIKVLSEEASLKLLRSFVSDGRIDQDLETAKQVCEWLGYLPLGLELVGRYLARKKGFSIAGLWERLQAQRLAAKALLEAEAGMTASLGVMAAFELSWQELNEEAQRLAALLSLFALAEIPWALVQGCLPEMDEEDLEDLRDEQLVNLSLLNFERNEVYQLHQLLREFFVLKREQQADAEELKRNFCRLMVAIANQIPQVLTLPLLQQIKPAIPHIEEAATTLKNYLSDDDLTLPFTGLAWFYQEQAFYNEALRWKQSCLETVEKRLGQNHPDVSTSLNNLAELHRKQGRYAEAEPLYLRALEIEQYYYEDSLSSDKATLNNLALLYTAQERYVEAEQLHLKILEYREREPEQNFPKLASTLNNLASVYQSQERHTEAEALYLKALEIQVDYYGNNHPDVATSLYNLASLFTHQERYVEAESLYKQSIEILQNCRGEYHPEIATDLSNLAFLYRLQERYESEEELLLQALEILERHFGKDDFSLVSKLLGLVELYDLQKRYVEAESLLLKALEISRYQLGDEHPNVINLLSSLAALYWKQGRYIEAEPLYLRVLEIKETRVGSRHLDVVVHIRSLAHACQINGRYNKAELLYMRALEIDQRSHGKDHPEVASDLNNLAVLYRLQERYDEAESLYLQALDIKQGHSDIAVYLNNLAYLYYLQGRYNEAESSYLQALEINQSHLGSDHLDLAPSLNNFAELYYSQGHYDEAEVLYLQALEIRQQHLKANHPDVATSLHNLASLRNLQARYDEAEVLYLQALEIRLQHPDRLGVTTTLNNLAVLVAEQRRYSEAEVFFLQALETLFEKLGTDHPDTEMTRSNFQVFLQNVIQNHCTDELSDDPLTQEALREISEGDGV